MLRTATSIALVVLAACGGGQAPVPPAAGLSGDGGASSSPGTTPPPPGLPPMATMPPPGVAGSKKAKLEGAQPCDPIAAPDPAEAVKRTAEACAVPNKMRALGPVLRGQQADKGPHAEHRFRVEANKCYRVFFATSDGARDAVAVVRDSAGDVVAESAPTSVPARALMCFTTADEVTLLVGIGSGSGSYAAQIWSN